MSKALDILKLLEDEQVPGSPPAPPAAGAPPSEPPAPNADEPEDDEDEEEDEKPVQRKRKTNVNQCPNDHTFGKDTDKFEDCEDCELWNDCYAAKRKNKKA